MKKFSKEDLDAVQEMITRRKGELLNNCRKKESQANNPFSRFNTFFATPDPGFQKPDQQ